MELIIQIISAVYNFLWGDLFTIPLPGGNSMGVSLLVLLLIPTGIYFTIRTRAMPLRLFPEMLRVTVEKRSHSHLGSISGVQALVVSTATRVGMGNLVGVVAEVGENWATVRTLVDSDTEMGGQLARTGGAAILEGYFALMGEGRLKLTYLPENSELIAGDLVTTSGRGGVYPAGLVAGHVEEVRTDASGMTRYAVIAPETDLDGLQQVFVITDFTVNE